MARNLPPQNEAEKNQRKQKNEHRAAVEEQVSLSLRNLSDNSTALLDQIKAENRAQDARQQKHQADQIYWLRFSALAGFVLSLFTVLVLALTLVKTCNLADNAVRQSNIMATQAAIMDKQRQIGEEAQAPQIIVSVVVAGMSGNVPKVEITLRNTGRCAAENLSVRSIMKVIAENFVSVLPKNPRLMPVDPRLPESARADIEQWNEIEMEQYKIAEAFESSLNPVLPYDQQAPVVPSEEIFEKQRRLSLEYQRMREKSADYWRARGKTVPLEPPVLPEGTKMIVVGELGPDGGVSFVPELNEFMLGSKNAALYVACRVSYTYNNRPYAGSNFCFRYAPDLGSFTLCTRPAES